MQTIDDLMREKLKGIPNIAHVEVFKEMPDAPPTRTGRDVKVHTFYVAPRQRMKLHALDFSLNGVDVRGEKLLNSLIPDAMIRYFVRSTSVYRGKDDDKKPALFLGSQTFRQPIIERAYEEIMHLNSADEPYRRTEVILVPNMKFVGMIVAGNTPGVDNRSIQLKYLR
jgi:hypothetical protein